MAINIRNALIVLLVFAGLLSNPPDLSSCGPFLPTAAFSFWRAPEDPAGRFARGRLGIVQRSFPRFYLVIAYRHLAGIGLNAAERTALFGPETAPPGTAAPRPDVAGAGFNSQVDAIQQWQNARARVAGGPPAFGFNTDRIVNENNYFLVYPNCGDDAFRTAAATLTDRIRRFGLNHPAVKEWVAAQDTVFANCQSGHWLPPPPGTDAPPLLRADRDYQIAAATFYSGDLAGAQKLFRAIAEDKSSPWREIAPYLVARAMIRDATLSVKGVGADREKLAAAAGQLQRILNDPALKEFHPASQRLLDYVRARLAPAEHLHDLAVALVRKDSEATIQQSLTDYRFLYDQYERGSYGGLQALPANDDLTAWILNFQSQDADAGSKAVREWREKKTLPWLVAALAKASGSDPDAAELMEAGEKVGRDSPAYETAAFHANRLLIESNRANEARKYLDEFIAKETGTLPESSLNLFRAERMKIAENWGAFLKYAPRIPAGTGVGFAQYGNPDVESEDSSFPENTKAGEPAFDVDAAKILNEQTPLDLLLNAARSNTLPRPLRRSVAMAGWVRSVLLDETEPARSLATTLQELAPDLNQPIQVFLDTQDPRERRFAAVFLILRIPGLRPYVATGFGRLTPLAKLDNVRDNWWCAFAEGQGAPVPDYYHSSTMIPAPLHLLYPNGIPAANFLSAAERDRGRREWSRLAALPNAPEYLATQTVAWVKDHPRDPRAPEALHLAVRAVRYGCGAKAGASKEAFQLLHQRYPNSEWAKKTKYWY